MEAIIKLKPSELRPDLVGAIQKMFSGQRVEIEIHVHDSQALLAEESPAEYRKRIDAAIENVEQGKNVVHFTGEEFEALMTKMVSGN